MSQAIQTASIPISTEVAEFAAEQGVTDILPAVIEMTQRLYPGAPLAVVVEDDPEIADDRHIVLIVRLVVESVEEGLKRRRSWHRDIFTCCPAPLVCVFRIGVETD